MRKPMEVYLSDLEWTKTHNNVGGVMGNIVFKDNMSYEEYRKLFKTTYFTLCDKDYITNLEQANERLKETNVYCNRTDCSGRIGNSKKVEELQNENQQLKKVIDKAINELFNLKDMIYKPETREENIDIQRKISSIIKKLNVKEVE